MARWFRRKDKKDEVNSDIEPLEAQRTEAEPEATGSPEGAAAPLVPDQDIPPEVEKRTELESSETVPEPEDSAGEGEVEEEALRRPRFFHRLFHKEQGDTESFPTEAAPEPEPETEPGAITLASAPEEAPDAPEEEAPLSPEEEASLAAVPEARRGLFRRFRERLGRTRKTLVDGIDLLFAKHPFVDENFLDKLEELLITADLGVETTLSLIGAMQERVRRRELGQVERLKGALKAAMLDMLKGPPPKAATARPWVVLLVGVNGVGKTTTIAKLAYRDRQEGREPLLIAADTFRAAAAEQLEVWGQRLGAPVIRQQHGADPAAVVFDGLSAALSRGVDTVYIDTAGRLHTKVNLMEELKKIHRTTAKKFPGAPHEVLLILDATTGQNAISQARLFQEAVGVTGIILTKLDGTAKGGVALAVAHETGIPLCYLGMGESLDDLKPFDPEAFVEAIMG
jgi:fused signal recognition particle receptor